MGFPKTCGGQQPTAVSATTQLSGNWTRERVLNLAVSAKAEGLVSDVRIDGLRQFIELAQEEYEGT
ncbi:hypothetical protein [Pontiella desulfatans]|uniref:hypothetical protein n=1 Tax=Pontiella desulfatans TaxID=2750659 RepID=UPI00109C757C|nr:hypothetical protein [Pontiella desulfatans]